jgi:hypothetical protein
MGNRHDYYPNATNINDPINGILGIAYHIYLWRYVKVLLLSRQVISRQRLQSLVNQCALPRTRTYISALLCNTVQRGEGKKCSFQCRSFPSEISPVSYAFTFYAALK